MDETKPDDSARPSRPPPTIDLKATEVPRDDAAPSEPSPDVATSDSPAARKPGRTGTVLLAIVFGALSGAAGAAGLYALALTQQWPVALPTPGAASTAQRSDASALDALRDRIAKLEQRPAPAAAASAAPAPSVDLGPLDGRVTDLDTAVKASQRDIATLRAEIAQTRKATTETPAASAADADQSAALAALAARLDTADETLRAQAVKLSAATKPPPDDKPLRRVSAATLLDQQVRAGEPYAAALAIAKSLAPDAAILAPLDPFAANGIPSASTLSQDLLALPRVAPPATSTSGGLLARLQDGAGKLVRIERTDAPPGETAAFDRAAQAARRGDVAGAARELAALPADDRVAVQGWLDRVAARDKALAASRSFAADSLAFVAKPLP